MVSQQHESSFHCIELFFYSEIYVTKDLVNKTHVPISTNFGIRIRNE